MIDFECCFFRISYYIRKRSCIKKGWEISTENRRMTVFDTGDGLKGIECIPKSEWWTYLKHYLKKKIKNEKVFSIIAIIALLMVFVSCSKPISRSGDGVIIDKWYKPSYTTTVLIPSGKTLIPINQAHPAVYGVTIKVGYNDYSYTTDYRSSQLHSKKKGTKVRVEWTEKVYKKDGALKIDISDVKVVGIYNE